MHLYFINYFHKDLMNLLHIIDPLFLLVECFF